MVKQKRRYDVSLILEFYFQPQLREREIGWFELILQLQTAQCQMFITVNVTLIYSNLFLGKLFRLISMSAYYTE